MEVAGGSIGEIVVTGGEMVVAGGETVVAGGETLMTGGEPMVAGGSLEEETGCRLDASLVGRHRPLPLAGRRSGIKPIHSFVLLLEIQQFHQLQSDCSISRGLVTPTQLYHV